MAAQACSSGARLHPAVGTAAAAEPRNQTACRRIAIGMSAHAMSSTSQRRTEPGDVRRIREYYRQNQPIYDRYWTEPRTLSMNYGLWSDRTRTREQAFVNQNRLIARALAPRVGDRVLEMGCGTGGSSIWLAQTPGLHVTGITLVPEQVQRARQFASAKGVALYTAFVVGDYLCTPFADASFERIFASESACYARDKLDFLREAWRF